jgi:hypothetical protein
VAWVKLRDPFSGVVRQQLLNEAYAQGDAPRCASFFRAYLDQQQTAEPGLPSTPTAQTPAPAAPAPAPAAGQPTLAEFAAPGRVGGPAPVSAADGKRYWTQNEIKAFYRARVQGHFVGREAEASRLENDIIAAATEGRIR